MSDCSKEIADMQAVVNHWKDQTIISQKHLEEEKTQREKYFSLYEESKKEISSLHNMRTGFCILSIIFIFIVGIESLVLLSIIAEHLFR